MRGRPERRSLAAPLQRPLYKAIAGRIGSNHSKPVFNFTSIFSAADDGGIYYLPKFTAPTRRNLIPEHSDFTSAFWTKFNMDVVPNAGAASDGSQTADKLVPTTTSGLHYVTYPGLNVVLGQTYTLSVEANAAEVTTLTLTFQTAAFGNTTATFNLANGTVSSVTAGATATITAAGNGNYRCSLTKDCTTSNVSGQFYINPLTTYAGDGTSGYLVSRVQWEQSSVPTAFQDWAVEANAAAGGITRVGAFTDLAGTVPAVPGDKVRYLRDFSGKGCHLTAAFDPNRPTLAVDENGYWYLQGDGTNTFLRFNSLTRFRFLHDGSGATLGAAARLDTPIVDAKTHPLIGTGVGTSTRNFALRVVASTNNSSQLGARIGNGTVSVINANNGAAGSARQDGYPQSFIGTYKTQAGNDMHLLVDNTDFRPTITEAATPSTSDSSENFAVMGGVGSNYMAGRWYGGFAINREIGQYERARWGRWLRSLYGDTGHFVAFGDSHTFNTSYGFNMQGFYPARLDVALRAGGKRLAPVNLGISGNTTANIVARMDALDEAGAPEFAVLYAGTNDSSSMTTVQASPAPTSTTFAVASGVGIRYGANAIIKVGSQTAEVLSVSGDVITLKAALSGGAPAAGTAVESDVTANLVKTANYVKAMGCNRILICGQHFINFASGGESTSGSVGALETLRAKQRAAAEQVGGVYVDLYDWMRDLIVAGTYTLGNDLAWHVSVGNTHLNQTGEQILADAIYAAMQAQGWA